ncbi:MAG: hypothetical protein ACRDK4_14640 [Solirubrobacteraceae bacterium]
MSKPSLVALTMTETPKRRRVPTRAVVLVGIGVIFGIAGVVAELEGDAVRDWTVEHPFTVTLGTGLILLLLTVFAVERWLAWTESKRWRVPSLAALDAYAAGGLAVHQRLYDAFLSLPGADKFSSRGRPTEESVEKMMEAAGALSAFGSIVSNEMSGLAPVALLAIQTVARHEPYGDLIGLIAGYQANLGTLATHSESLVALSVYGDGLAAAGLGPGRPEYDEWAANNLRIAEAMAETLDDFYGRLERLKSALFVVNTADTEVELGEDSVGDAG